MSSKLVEINLLVSQMHYSFNALFILDNPSNI
jgi:hypothetical protein